MKDSFVKYPGLIVAAGLCLASAAFGGQTTLELISGGGLTNNATVAGIYTSPYDMLLNGTLPPLGMFCDDWADNINANQEWYVQSTALSAITGTSLVTDNKGVYFGTDAGNQPYDDGLAPATLTQEVKYVAAVELAVEITQLALADTTKRAELSLALWDIFNPAATNDGGPASLMDAVSKNDLKAAITFAQGYTSGSIGGYTATIYTPLASSSGYDINPGTETLTGGIAKSGNPGVPQEFIKLTPVPEPATWGVLGFDLFGAGIVGLYFRRRKSRAQS